MGILFANLRIEVTVLGMKGKGRLGRGALLYENDYQLTRGRDETNYNKY